MGWEYLGETRPKAKKAYRCMLCWRPIYVGEVHVARRGVQDGTACTSRMHEECEAAVRGWNQDSWDNHSPGNLKRPLRLRVV